MLFTWAEDGVFVPRPAYRKACDQTYAVGEIYRLDIREDRSESSHRHFFASVREAWVNLPEDLAAEIPTAEHLRKWALIKAGYRDTRKIAAATETEAERLAAIVHSFDDFAVVTQSDNVVTIHTAKSQSRRAMGKEEFQKSKEDVLDICAGLVKVDRDELQRNAGKAA